MEVCPRCKSERVIVRRRGEKKYDRFHVLDCYCFGLDFICSVLVSMACISIYAVGIYVFTFNHNLISSFPIHDIKGLRIS